MKLVNKTALAALMGTTALTVSFGAVAQEVTDEIVVRGVNIPDEKRATSEISAVLDEASFDRTGDSNIADALSRVTGLSISDGKFVIVRGLNERYSSVTIDGSTLPSPEPLRRVVPLDLIPTSILSGSLVQKTFSPQFSGEFGGGLVELRTKPIPEEAFFSVDLSVGLDTATTGDNGLTYEGGKRDWLGFDDGTRNTPDALQSTLLSTGVVPAGLQDVVDASVDSANTTLIVEQNTPVNWGVSLSGGAAHDVNDDIRAGINLAFSLKNDWQTRIGTRNQGLTTSDNALNADRRAFDGGASFSIPLNSFLRDFESTALKVTANGAATLGVEIGDNHSITSTNLFLRSTTKEARQSVGIIGEDETVEVLRSNLEFFEQQVWQTQLRGDHVFPALADLSVVWRGAYGEAFRDAPYQRQYQQSRLTETDTFSFRFGNTEFGEENRLTFSKVEDQNAEAGLDFTLPLVVAEQNVDINFGAAYSHKERNAYVRELSYSVGTGFTSGTVPEAVNLARPDVAFSSGVTGTGVLDLSLATNTITLDNADSFLNVFGAYGQVDFELGPYLRLAAGVRYEDGVQKTKAFSTGSPTNSFSVSEVDEDYFLPAATITWNPIDDVQVRAGFSQTIVRPQFRELTPAIFLDDDTDQLFIGNPFLVNSEINNFDARAEYYFGRGQFVTVGGFYKDIENPIEATATQIGGASAVTFVNAPSAKLYGAEVEFEKTFVMADLIDSAMFDSKDLIFKANYTWSQSEVGVDGTVTTSTVSSASGAVPTTFAAAGAIVDGRALQGQSDHLFNLQLGYEDVERNSRATLLVNWSSKRIRQTRDPITGGVEVIEKPPLLIDFVWSRELDILGGGTEIGFEVRNILGEDYEAVQNFAGAPEVAFDTYKLGRSLSASLKKSF